MQGTLLLDWTEVIEYRDTKLVTWEVNTFCLADLMQLSSLITMHTKWTAIVIGRLYCNETFTLRKEFKRFFHCVLSDKKRSTPETYSSAN